MGLREFTRPPYGRTGFGAERQKKRLSGTVASFQPRSLVLSKAIQRQNQRSCRRNQVRHLALPNAFGFSASSRSPQNLWRHWRTVKLDCGLGETVKADSLNAEGRLKISTSSRPPILAHGLPFWQNDPFVNGGFQILSATDMPHWQFFARLSSLISINRTLTRPSP